MAGLETGEADQDGDGLVSVNDLYRHVFDEVKAAGSGQTPTLWAFGIERGLYMARRATAAPRPDLRIARPATRGEDLLPNERLVHGPIYKHWMYAVWLTGVSLGCLGALASVLVIVDVVLAGQPPASLRVWGDLIWRLSPAASK